MLVRIIKNNISFIGHETIFSCFRFVLESFVKNTFRCSFWDKTATVVKYCNSSQLICLHSHVQFIDLRHAFANFPKTFELAEKAFSASVQHRLYRTLACQRILHARGYVGRGPRCLPSRPNDSGWSPLRFVPRTLTTVSPTSSSSNRGWGSQHVNLF